MPRQVILREKRASTQLRKNSGEATSQRVICGRNCVRDSGMTIRTALSRNQAFPMLNAETSTSVAMAAHTAIVLRSLNRAIRNAESITTVNNPEPKNDTSHKCGIYTRVSFIWRVVNSRHSRNEQRPGERVRDCGTKRISR